MTNKTFGKRVPQPNQGVALIVDNYGSDVVLPLPCGYCDPLYIRTKQTLIDAGFTVRPGAWSDNDRVIGRAVIGPFPFGSYQGYIRQ